MGSSRDIGLLATFLFFNVNKADMANRTGAIASSAKISQKTNQLHFIAEDKEKTSRISVCSISLVSFTRIVVKGKIITEQLFFSLEPGQRIGNLFTQKCEANVQTTYPYHPLLLSFLSTSPRVYL